MRKLLVGAAIVAISGLAVAPATAGNAVKSKTKVVDVVKEAHDQVGVYAKLKTSLPCLQPKRKFLLFDQDGKADAMNGYSDTFIITSEVGIGDTIQVKTTSVTIAAGAERVKCKGSTSKEFEIAELSDGGS